MAKMSISSIQNNPLCADGARVPAKFHSDYLLKNALGMNFKIKEEELGPRYVACLYVVLLHASNNSMYMCTYEQLKNKPLFNVKLE